MYHTSLHMGCYFCNWSHDNIYDIIQVTYADSRYVKHWVFFFSFWVFVIWQLVSSWISFWRPKYLPSWKISCTLYTIILGTYLIFSLTFQHFLIFQRFILCFINKDHQEKNVLQLVSKKKRAMVVALSTLPCYLELFVNWCPIWAWVSPPHLMLHPPPGRRATVHIA